MIDTGVLAQECIDRTEPDSEGRSLSHMFNLMAVTSQYVEIRCHSACKIDPLSQGARP